MKRGVSIHKASAGVIFDGDDTLWITEPLYDKARRSAAEVVGAHGVDPVNWEELQRRLDVENTRLLKYSTRRFPTSCVQAYDEACRDEGFVSDPAARRDIWKAAQSVFRTRAPLAPGARDTLERLGSAGMSLALLTKGDAQVQSRRIETSGLRELFASVEVVPEKSPPAIRLLVTRLGINPQGAWMVGNSLRSDILPALTAGLRAIWIDAPVWEYERSPNGYSDNRVIAVDNLAEVPDLLLQ
jgi:putative hydrolase of the HAD superfamily